MNKRITHIENLLVVWLYPQIREEKPDPEMRKESENSRAIQDEILNI